MALVLLPAHPTLGVTDDTPGLPALGSPRTAAARS
jgi:hypothetical protein